MAAPSLPASCDVAVIGAGVGGLTAAALLAQAGLGVVVLERESRPGGYLAGFHRKAFVFDSAVHWLNQCGPGGMVHRVFHALGDDAPDAPLLKRIRRYRGDSFDWLLTREPDQLKAQLQREFPEDARGLERFFGLAYVLGHRMTSYARFMRSTDTLSPLQLVGRGLALTGWSYPFWRLVGDRDCRALDDFFTSPDLKKIFCSEANILSCLVPIGWAKTGDYQRPPRGGSQAFIKWLVERVSGWGSQVALRAEVQAVTVDHRRATGVALADGRRVRARWVIGAGDLDALLSRLLPAETVPAELIARHRGAELYSSCVSVSLGLTCDVRTLGLDEELVFLTRDGLPRHGHNDGNPRTSGLSILAPSARDPSLAPEGKGTLTICCEAHLAYGDRWKTGPGLERGEAYQRFKREYAEVLIDRVHERVAPGLKEHIELIDVATPVTHLRYTGNRDGTIMGQRATRVNMKAKVAGYRTVVEGLLIGGHWAEYGGGVPMAVKAAANAAAIVLKREKPEAFKRLCQALDQRLA